MTEDAVVGWHVQLNGHGFEQTQEDSEGQGGLGSMGLCWCPWGCKESDTTELNHLKNGIEFFKFPIFHCLYIDLQLIFVL